MDFFTADHHFNHQNVIKYSKRPWFTVEEMNNALIQKWNNRVSKEDRVFVLGDFALANKGTIRTIVPQLNGTKILVRGNHDAYRSPFYAEAGFHAISPYPMLYTDKSGAIDGQFILSHEPVNPLAPGLLNIHGHMHNNENPKFYAPNHICVSVEMTNYAPVTLKEILRMVREKREAYRTNGTKYGFDDGVEEYDLRSEIIR